jgi:hypothetical protein
LTASTRPSLFRLAAFSILFLGLALAVWVDQGARREQSRVARQDAATLAVAPLAPGDSKRYGYQVGQLSGEAGVLVDRGMRAAGWLFHGRPLAVMIAVVSFAGAGALLAAADKAGGGT